jgi:hypothetical protein
MEHKRSPDQLNRGVPDGFREVRMRNGWGWVRPAALAWFQEALTDAPTLYAAAGEFHRSSEVKGPLLQGRAPVFVIPGGATTPVAVRHYFRGGVMASLLGDRYLRFGAPRPIAETLASERLRSLGILTPRVVAASVYPRGPFYRGDIATEFVGGGVDLGEVLFGSSEQKGRPESPSSTGPHSNANRDPGSKGEGEASLRLSALTETMMLIDRLASARIYHPDLNVKNFLVEVGTSAVRVHLLDLDRCRGASGGTVALRDAMIRRLCSSLTKWERTTGRRLTREEWETTGYMSIT